MITTRRLRIFIRRVFGSTWSHQPAAIHYLTCPPNVPYRAQALQITTLRICRNFGIGNECNAEQDPTFEVEEDEIRTFKKYLSELPNQQDYADALRKALGCSLEELKKIQQNNYYWRRLPIDTVLQRIEAFIKLGVKNIELVEHSSLIFADFEISHHLLNLSCEVLGYNGCVLFPLLQLPKDRLLTFLRRSSMDSQYLGQYQNRIRYLSSIYKVDARNITEMLVKFPFLLTAKIKLLVQKMDILLGAGFARRHIYAYPRVFSVSVVRIIVRAAYCQEKGLTHIKPWVFYCSDKAFKRYVERRKLLQGKSAGLTRDELIAKLLICSIKEVEAIKKDERKFDSVSPAKAVKTIMFLLAEGFSHQEILRSPQVFLASVRCMQRRFNMYREAGLNPVHHSEILRRMDFSAEDFQNSFKKYL